MNKIIILQNWFWNTVKYSFYTACLWVSIHSTSVLFYAIGTQLSYVLWSDCIINCMVPFGSLISYDIILHVCSSVSVLHFDFYLGYLICFSIYNLYLTFFIPMSSHLIFTITIVVYVFTDLKMFKCKVT